MYINIDNSNKLPGNYGIIELSLSFFLYIYIYILLKWLAIGGLTTNCNQNLMVCRKLGIGNMMMQATARREANQERPCFYDPTLALAIHQIWLHWKALVNQASNSIWTQARGMTSYCSPDLVN